MQSFKMIGTKEELRSQDTQGKYRRKDERLDERTDADGRKLARLSRSC